MQNSTKVFSRELFSQHFPIDAARGRIEQYFNRAIQHPTGLYLFFQRYTYFNACTSAVISRLASSIAMSWRSTFKDPSSVVTVESYRAFNLAEKVMVAAYDEGTNDGAPHRTLGQLLLRTMASYANLSVAEQNHFANVPTWLTEICDDIMTGYAGVPGNTAALIRSMGFHAASEFFGDIEHGLIDKIVRYDNKNVGFDKFLSQTPADELCGHRYHPWSYVLVHASHDGAAGVEDAHFDGLIDGLNSLADWCPESPEQIMEWVLEGFQQFMNLEQSMFHQVDEESQAFVKQLAKTPELSLT